MAYNVCAAHKWIATSFPILISFSGLSVCVWVFVCFFLFSPEPIAVPTILPLIRKHWNEICLSLDWAPKHRVQMKSYYYHWTHSTLAGEDLTQRWRWLWTGRYFHMRTICIRLFASSFRIFHCSLVMRAHSFYYFWINLLVNAIFFLRISATTTMKRRIYMEKRREREKGETESAFILKHFIRK